MANQPMPEKLGRYEVVRELGKGAMGVVYEGRDPHIGRRVAIKTALRDLMESSGMADELVERFLREARAAGGLNHPNIITIYDAGEQDGIAYIAMEYLEGGDLQDRMRSSRRPGVEEAVELCATVCDALAHAHGRGIVHRDVKPANIMIPEEGPVKVADFGIAHVNDSNLTQEGAIIGTPHYMSPEQFMSQKLDGRSDLFSVGIILYEMVTGEKPFCGEAFTTIMHGVVKVNPIPPRELNFAVNEELDTVVMKALSKEPRKRYQSGTLMAAALRETLKPNPDRAVLYGEMPDDGDATVVAGDTDATLVAGREGEATVAGSRAKGLGTVAASTVGTAAPGDATVADGAVPGPSTGVRRLPNRRALLAAGGAVLALVVLAGVLWARTGTGPEPPPDGPYYAGFSVWVSFEEDGAPVDGAPVRVTNYDRREFVSEDTTNSVGLADGFEEVLASHPRAIVISVMGEEWGPYVAESPGQRRPVDIQVRRSDVPSG